LESAHQAGLGHELHLRNIDFAQQVDRPVNYKSVKLDCGYRIDLIVADRVVGELSLCKK
jgi:GxxExxY protein